VPCPALGHTKNVHPTGHSARAPKGAGAVDRCPKRVDGTAKSASAAARGARGRDVAVVATPIASGSQCEIFAVPGSSRKSAPQGAPPSRGVEAATDVD